MGLTAEFLAQTQGITREDQDQFAMRSHLRAAKAHFAGEFKREMVPTWGRDEAGRRVLAATDCGFDTSAGNSRIAEDVAWAKLAALSEGAKLASQRLFKG